MLLVADEGVDRGIVDRLRSNGHEVLYVADMAPGIHDTDVLEIARQEDAVLVTTDKDFGELIFRQGRVAGGVILLRLAGLSTHEKADACAEAIKNHATEIRASFTVISPRMVRIRPQRLRRTG
jgi:predicted nuclease of predicted toxin-antitoxin system